MVSSCFSKHETNDYPRDMIDKLANACENVGFFYAIAAKKKEKKKSDANIEISEEIKVLREIRDLLAYKSSMALTGVEV
ncbi:unnamed protein product [Rotaria sp. Silwood1]|nr:unnamed protein product [Rotaria sp. Silwood1]CAF0925616.1 unnamed protein product [Rotaria sp. Silwood1]